MGSVRVGVDLGRLRLLRTSCRLKFVWHNFRASYSLVEKKNLFEIICVSTEEYKKSNEMNTDEMNEEGCI